MARARNVKPGLFKNEILGVADPLYTLLFEGLWLLADREGRLEDRPVRIKGELFPYRDGLDVNAMLNWLEQNGFIRRYSSNGLALIQIIAFAKHQTPHGTEKDSELPDDSGKYTVHTRGKNGYATGEVSLVDRALTVNPPSTNALTPDSGFLIPDSLTPTTVGDSASKSRSPRPPRKKREETTLATYLQQCREQGAKAVPEDHPVRAYCRDLGASEEMVQVAWCVFRDDYTTGKGKDKRYKDWPTHFHNAIRKGWVKVWYAAGDGTLEWSQLGLQARKVLDERQRAKEDQHA